MKFAKFCIILIFILSLTACALTVVLFSVRENEKEKRIQLEGIRAQLEEQVGALRDEKQKLQVETDSLNDKLKASMDSLSEAKARADRAEQDLQTARESLSAGEKEVADLKRAVQLSEERNHDLEGTLSRLEATIDELRQGSGGVGMGQAASALSQDASMGGVSAAVSKSIQSRINGTAGSPSTAASSESLQAGRVLLVNRKFNFVIINMGSKQGVQIGDLFSITEGGEKIAKVQVEKLYDDYSAAKISEMTSDPLSLKEGNLVTRS